MNARDQTVSTPAQLRARTAYRQRQKAKLERYEAALREIEATFQEDTYTSANAAWLMVCVARKALGDDA